MNKLLILFFILVLSSCGKPKSVLICGDHECINKSEAKQYFKENLTLEVKIISNKEELTYDLIDLNLNSKKKNIKIKRNENVKVVKKLSKEEIKIKKKEIKNKKKIEKINPRKKDNQISKNIVKSKKINNTFEFSDICLKLKKCDIENITDYLIKLSNEKDFPNITSRE